MNGFEGVCVWCWGNGSLGLIGCGCGYGCTILVGYGVLYTVYARDESGSIHYRCLGYKQRRMLYKKNLSFNAHSKMERINMTSLSEHVWPTNELFCV